jgi:hypothetical protein
MSMKNARFRPLALCFLIGLCPPLLGHCGGDVVQEGTESGNPPVVVEQKLTLVANDSGVSVIGSVGAASPVTATVRVMNVTTGEVKDGVVASDGSFEVSIAGSLQDSYSVMIVSGANSTSVLITANDQGSTDVTSTTCEEREAALDQRLAETFASAQTACSVDADCTEVGWGNCFYGCSGSFIAASDAEAARTRAEQAGADLCAQLASCERVRPPCPSDRFVPACIAGTCQGYDPNQATCEDLAARAGQRRTETLDAADRTCQADSDCAVLPLEVSDCVVTCPTAIAVATSALSSTQTQLTDVEQKLCEVYTARSCPPVLRLPCAAPPIQPTAVCQNNQCEIQQNF